MTTGNPWPPVQRDLFRLPFGALVMIAHLRFGDRRGFVGGNDFPVASGSGRPMQPTVLV